MLMTSINSECVEEKNKRVFEDINDEIREGDIIFIRVPNFLYRRVADTTMSWTSHVGFVYGRENGEWIIAESSFPLSKKCGLKRFIERSENALISVRRLEDSLTEDQLEALREAADRRMKKRYHLGFRYDSQKEFCSKFVHDVFNEAMGIKIGEFETFRDLIHRNPDSPMFFWKTWFFGFVPWDRRTITPASLYESNILTTVYDNTVERDQGLGARD